ncbi:MAG: cardiolipin synthase [Sphingomonadales bacterium]|nr:cardiolipin synthase [Sphingomonadales bacterium]MBD3772659.1 cardiolipin synthase [Paracoccaceae bacterium]
MIDRYLPHSDWALAYFTFEWILRLVLIAVVLPGRPPASARIWLLFGFLTPVPAAIVYAVIGRMRNPPTRARRERHAAAARLAWLAQSAGPVAQATPWTGFVEAIGGNPPSGGNAIRLLTDYGEAVEDLVRAIEGARRQVRVLVYIFADDTVGRQVIAALAAARKRGVTVQVMFDAFGSRRWRRPVLAALRSAGIDARACYLYNPLAGGTGRLDRRNHRKITVIDDEVAFMGSQNLVARDFRPGVVNHELVLRIEGPLAAQLGAQFAADWIGDGGGDPGWPTVPGAVAGTMAAQLLPSGPGERDEAYTLLLSRLLQEARHEVLIVSPYTVLDEGLQLAVATAAMRGVAVTLLVSAVVDQPLVNLAQEAGYGSLMAAGVTIRRFEQGLLHAKYVLVDRERVVLGTSNADIRSLRINAEISLVSEDRTLAAMLSAVADWHLSHSRQLSTDQWRARPLHRRMLQRIAALASPLL